MNADPFAQLKLLDLQALDTTLTRLAARRRTLPALEAIAAAELEISRLSDTLLGFETEVADRGRAAAKLEIEIEQVRARSDRDQQRLDTGSVPAAQLESLQHEITSLARRQSSLEDDELEILEAKETAEKGVAETTAKITGASDLRIAAEAERDQQFAEIDAESAETTSRRAALATELPDDLLRLYERLRDDHGGTGAAALLRRRCEGCHLELAGNELTQVRDAPPQEVLRHDDCGRILVRTGESGL
ncbi:MAG TPA: C4-type zinc ribbon domain-containing protein [Mycobacteriales bacterium]